MALKVFADGANIDQMLSIYRQRGAQGFTTNPTLMRQAGITDYAGFARAILSEIKDLPISFEVFADDLPVMATQARKIASWGDNIYVKIPVTNSRRVSCAALVRELSSEGIKLNVTAILSLRQVEEVVEALAPGTPAVVSVFAGRIADTGRDPVPLMREAVALCAAKPRAELLWASPREVLNIYQAEQVGCHIITATPDLIRKLALKDKDLEDYSLETVNMFLTDAQAAGFTI